MMNQDFKANLASKLVKANSVQPNPTAWGQMNNLLDWEATGGAIALFHGRVEPNVRISNDNNELGIIRIESGRFELVTHNGQFTLLPNDTAFLSGGMHLENGDESGTFYDLKSRFYHRDDVPKIAQSKECQRFEVLGHRVGIVMASEEVECGFCLVEIETQPLLASRSLIHENADCVFIVRQGNYEFCLNDARIQVSTGDCIFVPRGACQSFRVISAHHGRLDLLTAPGGFERFLDAASRLLLTDTTQEFIALGISHGVHILTDA